MNILGFQWRLKDTDRITHSADPNQTAPVFQQLSALVVQCLARSICPNIKNFMIYIYFFMHFGASTCRQKHFLASLFRIVFRMLNITTVLFGHADDLTSVLINIVLFPAACCCPSLSMSTL